MVLGVTWAGVSGRIWPILAATEKQVFREHLHSQEPQESPTGLKWKACAISVQGCVAQECWGRSGGQEASGPMSLLWPLKGGRMECRVYTELMHVCLDTGPQPEESTDSKKVGLMRVAAAPLGVLPSVALCYFGYSSRNTQPWGAT